MNALANSQFGELQKYLDKTTYGDNPPVRFERFTGQEGQAKRDEIRANPPDILLTNYVMLDLILTRPNDCRPLITEANALTFLVLDELHTYRGRQGADIAMLLRRLANMAPVKSLQYIGTSATMSTEGTFKKQRMVIADVASTLFGATVNPEYVIGETLERVTQAQSDKELLADLQTILAAGDSMHWPDRYDDFISNSMTIWLENQLGIHPDADGHFTRQLPRSIGGDNGLACELSQLTGIEFGKCAVTIRSALLAGADCQESPVTRKKPLTFRLHQFFSRGENVYATIGNIEERHITLQGQQFALLAYRLYTDLRRGWRLTAPNLEQIDLLHFEYQSLEELCRCDNDWVRQEGELRDRHPAWLAATPTIRQEAAKTLLDHLRRELAIKVMDLDRQNGETLKRQVWQSLCDPWRFEDDEYPNIFRSRT